MTVLAFLLWRLQRSVVTCLTCLSRPGIAVDLIPTSAANGIQGLMTPPHHVVQKCSNSEHLRWFKKKS